MQPAHHTSTHAHRHPAPMACHMEFLQQHVMGRHSRYNVWKSVIVRVCPVRFFVCYIRLIDIYLGFTVHQSVRYWWYPQMKGTKFMSSCKKKIWNRQCYRYLGMDIHSSGRIEEKTGHRVREREWVGSALREVWRNKRCQYKQWGVCMKQELYHLWHGSMA